MSKITLNSVADITQATSAQTTINANSSTIQTAFDNTLSRDGTSPNQMGWSLDMNSNHILNLPTPSTANDPIRLQDVTLLNGSGTITSSPLPAGGTTGQVLSKHSNSNYDTQWSNPPAISTAMTPVINAATISTADNLLGVNFAGAQASLASASTTDLGSTNVANVLVTGTTTITSFGSSASTANPLYYVVFASSLQLTYNATSMQLLNPVNLQTVAGDAMTVQYLGSGNWKVLEYNYNQQTTPWLTHGSVRFENDGGAHSGVLYPFNGNGLWCYNPVTSRWQLDAIPAGTLSSGGMRFDITGCNVELNQGGSLAANQFYYVYYTRNVTGLVGVAQLNFSVNGHATNGTLSNTTPGPSIEIKNNDVTQTLVGMVYTLGGSIAGTGNNQLALSWFNRIKTRMTAGLSGSVSSTSSIPIPGSQVINIVMADDQAPHISLVANITNNTGATTSQIGVGLDGSTGSSGPNAVAYTDVANSTLNITAASASFAGTGFHSAQAVGFVSAGAMTVQSGQLNCLYES